MRVILDTGPLVALLNHWDIHHSWALTAAQALRPPRYTCEAVIAEAHHLLGHVYQGRRRLYQLVESGRLDFSFSYARDLGEVHALIHTYEETTMSFADACLVRMAEMEAGSQIFTIDSHFRVYRQHRTRKLKLLIP
ncbi:MAG: PIN domain-containing protein [Candidatus Handelsmanbacteria bacterium]|nr:PIN domain-containing protein [Candidatus Handelsmanbacteria bacterium]